MVSEPRKEVSMRFEHCCCTNAICAPSRAVILTGKLSHINGHRTNSDKFDGTQETYPKLLRAAESSRRSDATCGNLPIP
jgi:arylsulfatase A-like enzyme